MARWTRSHDELIRLGALTRLAAIERERAFILRTFPDFRRGASRLGDDGPWPFRRRLSAKARRAMSAGMRRYWARRKGAAGAPGARGVHGSSSGRTGRAGRRTMSAEARAKIAAAQRRRWARQKAAEKKD